MKGLFITFEGTEGGGKSTQIQKLAERIKDRFPNILVLREPGGTSIGEEIRHTLKHSSANAAMTPETELLLMNASRAQLVREVIRPALAAGNAVLCDRFADSTTAYQGYGRQLDLEVVRRVLDIAIGKTRPDLTLLLKVPVSVSEARRAARGLTERDRFEEADREFFRRVERGYDSIAATESARVRVIDATQTIDEVAVDIWNAVEPFLSRA